MFRHRSGIFSESSWSCDALCLQTPWRWHSGAETCSDVTYHELRFMICILLYFIQRISWSIYRNKPRSIFMPQTKNVEKKIACILGAKPFFALNASMKPQLIRLSGYKKTIFFCVCVPRARFACFRYCSNTAALGYHSNTSGGSWLMRRTYLWTQACVDLREHAMCTGRWGHLWTGRQFTCSTNSMPSDHITIQGLLLSEQLLFRPLFLSEWLLNSMASQEGTSVKAAVLCSYFVHVTSNDRNTNGLQKEGSGRGSLPDIYTRTCLEWLKKLTEAASGQPVPGSRLQPKTYRKWSGQPQRSTVLHMANGLHASGARI